MRMKEDRKIASIDDHIVRNVNGNGSGCFSPGQTFQAIQAPNTAACTQTKAGLPQNCATNAATRSPNVRLREASSSRRRIVSTLRRVISLALAAGFSVAKDEQGSGGRLGRGALP